MQEIYTHGSFGEIYRIHLVAFQQTHRHTDQKTTTWLAFLLCLPTGAAKIYGGIIIGEFLKETGKVV